MKEIRMVECRVGDLKLDFGNPRKIKKQKREELEESLETYGNFAEIVINEQYQVIGGNQRVSILKKKNPDHIEPCKMLIGYTLKELKYINLRLNSHSGEWDLDLLGDWTVDLTGDFKLDLEKPQKEMDERSIKEMEPIHYEQYDYVLIACRNELDYNDLTRNLGIDGAVMKVAKSRKIKGRAIWYDQMKAHIISAEEVAAREAEKKEAENGGD